MRLTKFHRWLDAHETWCLVFVLFLGATPGIAMAFHNPFVFAPSMLAVIYITVTRILYLNS